MPVHDQKIIVTQCPCCGDVRKYYWCPPGVEVPAPRRGPEWDHAYCSMLLLGQSRAVTTFWVAECERLAAKLVAVAEGSACHADVAYVLKALARDYRRWAAEAK